MKFIYSTIIIMVLSVINCFGQGRSNNNINIEPCDDTLCYGTELYVSVAGNSFNPTSYIWSNGSISPTSIITTSGTYTVTVTGFVGNSNQIAQVTKTKSVIVLEKPKVNPITELWVCRYDSVKLSVDAGYTNYSWNNGSNNFVFSRQMTGAGTGSPALDTVSVWYTASLYQVCQVNSDTVTIRGIRQPNGVGSFYEGRTDLTVNDSVPAGLVLTYLYPPQYEMEFTKVNDPNYLVSYITSTNSRFAPLNILDPGNNYYVRTRPIINGVTYCWGNYSFIGILPVSNFVELSRNKNEENSLKNFKVYDLSGKLVLEKISYEFNDKWIENYENKFFIIKQVDLINNSIISKKIFR